MRNHRTAARARVHLGVTIPMGSTYGSARVDVGFEDYERNDEGTEALRRRVAETALKDLKREIRRALKRYNLDDTGKPRGEQTWA